MEDSEVIKMKYTLKNKKQNLGYLTSPRERQEKWRNGLLKASYVALGCFIVWGIGLAGRWDYEAELIQTQAATVGETRPNATQKRTVDIPTETPTETTEQKYVYIICDVKSNDFGTLTVEMPNGELHNYVIIDPPEGKIELVTFRVETENQSDYSEYEVVAVR